MKNLVEGQGDGNVSSWDTVAVWQIIGTSSHECTSSCKKTRLSGHWGRGFCIISTSKSWAMPRRATAPGRWQFYKLIHWWQSTCEAKIILQSVKHDFLLCNISTWSQLVQGGKKKSWNSLWTVSGKNCCDPGVEGVGDWSPCDMWLEVLPVKFINNEIRTFISTST